MVPRRLHHAPLPPDGGTVRLDPQASRHARVLRLEPGAAVVLFDGQGREAEGRLLEVEASEGVLVRVGPSRRVEASSGAVTLCVAPPKGERLDLLVRMATEAGVARIVLLRSERTVVRWPPERAGRKLERLGRVAREAARQSGRADVPELVAPRPLLALATMAPGDACRMLLLPQAERSLLEELASRGPADGGCWLGVGPEGGFSPEEVAALRAAGWRGARLGPHVLRVETAAVVAVAFAVAVFSGCGDGRGGG